VDVEIVIRPQHLKLDFDRQGKGPLPTAQDGVPGRGHVVEARFMGSESLVTLRMEAGDTLLKASVPGVFLPHAGTALWLSLRRDRCLVFPCATQSKVKSIYVTEAEPV
ncbi:MAG: TOBE domain-containing protein, partial [Pseudomonadota bacterium]